MLRDRIDRLAYPDRDKLAVARAWGRNPTPAERHAWSLLRNHGILSLEFRRQYILHGFIVDLRRRQPRGIPPLVPPLL